MPPTTDVSRRAWGARLFRRLVGVSRRQRSHPINALTRSSLERDGFEVWPVRFSESQRSSPDHEA